LSNIPKSGSHLTRQRAHLGNAGLYLFGVEHPDCGDDLGKALVARCVEVGQIIQELGRDAISGQ
jgi:hypothetical protein